MYGMDFGRCDEVWTADESIRGTTIDDAIGEDKLRWDDGGIWEGSNGRPTLRYFASATTLATTPHAGSRLKVQGLQQQFLESQSRYRKRISSISTAHT